MRVWLDDVREMPDDYDIHVETVEDAISLLEEYEVTHVGFDHDLGYKIDGKERTGYHLACWIEAEATRGLPKLTWSIQSDNPPGAKKIAAAMQAAERYWRAVDSLYKNHGTYIWVFRHFKDHVKTSYWFTHRDPALGNRTPVQLLLDDDYETLEDFIEENFIEDEEQS